MAGWVSLKKIAKILVVDDVASIRSAIRKYLSQEFEVSEAANANEAIELCKQIKMDLVITDIKMPGISGIDLIRILRKDHPDTKYVLMTAYNVDDFVSLLRKEKIWNIIPKSTFLDINSVLTLSRKLLCQNPFGIHYYFPQAQTKELMISDIHRMHRELPQKTLTLDDYYICRIATPEENRIIGANVAELLLASGAAPSVQQVLEELCANALRYTKKSKSFDLGFGILEKSVVIGVIDYEGTLDRELILLHLERQVSIDADSGLPVGLKDAHGRGLYITRENCDHLVFNIDPGHKTEIIAILKTKAMYNCRAVSIFQKQRSSV